MKLRSKLLLITLLAAASTAGWSAPVNINSADAATLAQELKGIGAVKAQAIVDYRQKHGPFRSIDELAQVKGISQKLIDRNRAELRLDRSVAVAVPAAPARSGVKPVSHK
jgi:competence protein ComEA